MKFIRTRRENFPTNFIAKANIEFTTTSIITINPGEMRDSTDSFNIILESPSVLDITAFGFGGLDVGSEAFDIYYAVYVIADSTDINVPKGIFSTSVTSPTLPSGYDLFRRVGMVKNNSSGNFLNFYQFGSGNTRKMRYLESLKSPNNLIVLSAGTSAVFADVDCSPFAPCVSDVIEIFIMPQNKDGVVRPNGTSINFASYSASSKPIIYEIQAPGQIIEYANDSSGGSTDISVLGYYDEI
ncbi:MAG: hypothetical protein O6940_05885 [Ignavibacteria bacterium]|nr:hypothetical protein [Ignavibacteria bacterium]